MEGQVNVPAIVFAFAFAMKMLGTQPTTAASPNREMNQISDLPLLPGACPICALSVSVCYDDNRASRNTQTNAGYATTMKADTHIHTGP